MNLQRLTSGVLAMALLATACGDGEAAPATTDAPATTVATVAPTTTAAPTTTTTVAPTTTSSTTTTWTTTSTMPPLDEEAVAFIEQWADVMNAGDHATGAEMLIAADQFDSPGDDETRTFFEVWVVLESQLDVDECRTLSSGVTRCRVTRHVELSPHAPDPETSRLSVRLNDDGSLAYAATEAIQTDPWFYQYGEFKVWVRDNYGGPAGSIFDQLFGDVDPATYAQLLEEQIAIWKGTVDG